MVLSNLIFCIISNYNYKQNDYKEYHPNTSNTKETVAHAKLTELPFFPYPNPVLMGGRVFHFCSHKTADNFLLNKEISKRILSYIFLSLHSLVFVIFVLRGIDGELIASSESDIVYV